MVYQPPRLVETYEATVGATGYHNFVQTETYQGLTAGKVKDIACQIVDQMMVKQEECYATVTSYVRNKNFVDIDANSDATIE